MVKEFSFEFIKKSSKCRHEKVIPETAGRFCPDCGKEIFISWLILRCKCCSVKRPASIYLNSIFPTEKYCSKCGSKKFYVERKYNLELYDFNYAVLVREEAESGFIQNIRTQVWIEEDHQGNSAPLKFIPSFSYE